jgi:hypothetical protein
MHYYARFYNEKWMRDRRIYEHHIVLILILLNIIEHNLFIIHFIKKITTYFISVGLNFFLIIIKFNYFETFD